LIKLALSLNLSLPVPEKSPIPKFQGNRVSAVSNFRNFTETYSKTDAIIEPFDKKSVVSQKKEAKNLEMSFAFH